MNALFLVLLFSVIGPAVSTPVPNLGEVAIVPVRGGFVMAWSDAARIYTERLDANLQAANAPFSFPLAVPSTVTSLLLASNGTSVLVAWREPHGVNVEAQYAAIVDPGAQAMLAGPLFVAAGAPQSAAGVKQGKYRLLNSGQVWTLDEHLGMQLTDFIGDAVAAGLSTSGEIGIAKKTNSVACTAGGGLNPQMFWQACDFDEAVTFTAPAGRSGFSFQWHTFTQGPGPVKPPPEPLLGAPLIAANGDGLVGAIAMTAGTSSICEVRDGGRAWTLPRPLIALGGNGADVLAVWRDSGLRAMFLDGETFTLADDGEVPKIVAAGSDTFVVIYRRGSSIVVQKVSRQSPRGRAVR